MNWMTELDLMMTCKELSKPEKARLPWWKKLETAYNCEQTSESASKKREENYPKKQSVNWFHSLKNKKEEKNQATKTIQSIGEKETIAVDKQKENGCQVKERLWGNAEGCE